MSADQISVKTDFHEGGMTEMMPIQNMTPYRKKNEFHGETCNSNVLPMWLGRQSAGDSPPALGGPVGQTCMSSGRSDQSTD